MNEIQKLLKGDFSFDEGFALFCKWSKQQSLMSWIGRKRDMEMLRYNLEKLSSALPRIANPTAANFISMYARKAESASVSDGAPEKKAESVSISPVQMPKHEKIYRAELPDFLQVLYDANSEDYRRMSAAHRKMEEMAAEGEREKAAVCRAEVLELSGTIKERWQRIENEYQQYKKKQLLETKGASGAIPFKESTVRSYISRNASSKNPDVRAEVLKRVRMLQEHNLTIKESTLKVLRENGIIE